MAGFPSRAWYEERAAHAAVLVIDTDDRRPNPISHATLGCLRQQALPSARLGVRS
jgi:hypothetical protein